MTETYFEWLNRLSPGQQLDEIRDAALAVLADPSYRHAAQRIRDEITALPGLDDAVRLLERLRGTGRRSSPYPEGAFFPSLQSDEKRWSWHQEINGGLR